MEYNIPRYFRSEKNRLKIYIGLLEYLHQMRSRQHIGFICYYIENELREELEGREPYGKFKSDNIRIIPLHILLPELNRPSRLRRGTESWFRWSEYDKRIRLVNKAIKKLTDGI